MRVIIQRVKEANVVIEGETKGAIGLGLVIFLGIEEADSQEDANWLCQKIIGLRIFNDSEGKMNISSQEMGAQYLVISQFTLHASTKKGNRPSYIKAARPEHAEPLYRYFIEQLKQISTENIACGIFGADMKVSLVNDGPVTLFIDTKNKE